MSVQELRSAKNKPLFVADNFLYAVDCSKDGRKYCRCVRAKTDKCQARVIIDKVAILHFNSPLTRNSTARIYQMERVRGVHIFMLFFMIPSVFSFSNDLSSHLLSKDPDLTLVKVKGCHNHCDERMLLERRQAVLQMKDRMLERPDQSVKQVYEKILDTTVAGLESSRSTEEIGTVMPTLGNVKSILQRHRGSNVWFTRVVRTFEKPYISPTKDSSRL